MTNVFNIGPIAPERNPPINPQYYNPSRFVISAISLGDTTTVTTSRNHNYVIGQLTRLLIPSFYGASQLNNVTGYVVAIPSSDELVLNVDSNRFNAFIPSPSYGPTSPQIVPLGDLNTGLISSTGRAIPNPVTIPGSFINVSPR